MFKKLETSWNAHTPKFLHNGSKENFIFQLSLVGVILVGGYVYDKYVERQERRGRERFVGI